MVDRKNSDLVQEGEVAPTKPMVKAFNGCLRTRSVPVVDG
jgi:hypothetical protein